MDWNNVVDELGPCLLRYFLASFPRQLASELVQETLLRLVSKISDGTYDPRTTSLKAYSYGIAHLVRLEALRKLPQEDLYGDPTEYDTRIESNTPARLASDIDERRALRRAIQALNETERKIILLLIDESLSLAEIAGILGLPEGTVKSHAHRAKATLREQLMQFVNSNGGVP